MPYDRNCDSARLPTSRAARRRDANDRARVFHSWSVQGALDPTVIAGALGSKFWDDDGPRVIDFTSMFVNMNLGHQHPKMIQAIKDQADVLCMVGPAVRQRPAQRGCPSHRREGQP